MFFTLLAMIWVGPFYRQVLHGRSPLFQPWGMFSGAGLQATEIEFGQRRTDGTEAIIDRYALLVPAGEVAPTSLRHIEGLEAARHVGRALCQALGADAHVVAHLRIATKRGWRSVMNGEEDLCAP